MRLDDFRRKTHDRIARRARPRLEGLEDRFLMYAAIAGPWSHPERVTFSYVPDGTTIGIGGPTSSLYSSLTPQAPDWQNTFRKAAAIWEQVSNLNLSQVSDNGTTLGSGSYQQGDPNMGDIRISFAPLPSGTLAAAFLPPPINGGTAAGDITFNSTQNWGTNGADLLTVAVHEFGHALGVGHSAVTTADMYAFYNATKQYLTTDDIQGIQSIYGARQPDGWTAAFNNTTKANSIDVTPLIDGSGQVAMSAMDITASATPNWFKVTVPSSTTGSFTATMQSTNLSELSPRVQVYNAAGLSVGYATAANTYGATVTLTLNGVTPGQLYYIRTGAANTGPTGAGNYGLLLNFGSSPQAPIPAPYTSVLNQADQGGGGLGDAAQSLLNSVGIVSQEQRITIGSVVGFGDNLEVKPRSVHQKHHPAGPHTHRSPSIHPAHQVAHR